LCCIADHCLSILSFFSFVHCAVLLITVCLFCLFFSLVIVLYCCSFLWSAIQHNDQRKKRTK
jgi:hypothetical protein